MGGKSDPTTKVQRRDVSIDQATNNLMKVAFKVDRDGCKEDYI